jgi:hypothetical protein
MANIWVTPENQATTNVELLPEDAEWLADQLDRITDPSDTPAAPDAASRIRQAITDLSDSEVKLTSAEIDAVRRVFELEPDPESSELRQLQDELGRWT